MNVNELARAARAAAGPLSRSSAEVRNAALAAMAEQGIKMEYFTIHKILGCGNFVLAVSEGAFAGKPTSYYDLFRVENGKIAEHWDVMETIAPESEWKHQNGKFNF